MDDFSNDFQAREEASIFPTAAKYGLIGGGISVILSLLSFTLGWADGSNLMAAFIVGIVAVAIYVVVQVMGVKHYRDEENNGLVKFGNAFGLALIIAVIIALIGIIFNYVYMNFIDPDYMLRMAENMEEMLEGYGMAEEQIEQTLADIEASNDPVQQLISGLGFGAVVGGISGLIIAAVMKREVSY